MTDYLALPDNNAISQMSGQIIGNCGQKPAAGAGRFFQPAVHCLHQQHCHAQEGKNPEVNSLLRQQHAACQRNHQTDAQEGDALQQYIADLREGHAADNNQRPDCIFLP